MRILIDMDDVLGLCVNKLIRQLNKTHTLGLHMRDITCWNLRTCIQERYPDISEAKIFSPLNSQGFFRNLKVVAGAQQVVRELGKNHELVIVTNLPLVEEASRYYMEDKLEWIKKYFPQFIESRNVVFTKNKYLVDGDILIDDAPHNILAFHKKAIVFSRPWNQHINHLPRAETWYDIPSLI
jgi:5'(3')-deoxyribonucleotidase